MANVDAEQNAATTQQADETESSESITLSEENLEALLNGVRGAAPSPKSSPKPAPPVPAEATSKSSRPETIAKTEPAKKEEPIASLASLQEALPVEAAPPPPFEAAPVALAPVPSAPQVAPQPDVNSKLALISAIKQRRAVTPRPEAPRAEPLAASGEQTLHAAETEAHEHSAVAKDTATEEAVPEVSSSRLSPVASAPAASRPMKVATEVQPQLPAKKVWANGPVAAPSEPRRSDALRAETPRAEAAKKSAPKATVAAPVVKSTDEPEVNELFASFGSSAPQQEEAKPKSFITSKAGMGVIGGAVAAAALTVYLLASHGSKKPTPVVNAPMAAPIEVSNAVATAAPSTDGKTATATAANQHPATTAPVPGAKPSVTSQPAGQPAVQQIPQQNATPQQNPSAQQTAAPATPRTVARTFTAPTAARPTSSPVVDAAPALAINSATPAAVALPARIAPLPPPPAAPAAAPAAAQPRQLNVAGVVQAAKLVRQVVPTYPAVAKAARVQGTVHFRAVIGTDGMVKSLTTLGGPLPLAQAATDAVKQWRYQPTLVDGKLVEVTTQIDVAFTL